MQVETREGKTKAKNAKECCAGGSGLGCGVGRASASAWTTGNVSDSLKHWAKSPLSLRLFLENELGSGHCPR